MSIILRIVEWFAKRKGKQLAQQFENDPKVKKEIEELDATWEKYRIESDNLSNKIDDYMKKHTDEDENENKQT